ncbi:alpha/beta hydrolase family esterase [Novosphingopyxis sp.]|uniref:extracellular catalytic domain type 1 short-chain-length polyhydroxyalkanoate depolymerase n=1 Tax=Novosphingopyxis sp. TaxID=2709690 RepID=UPI003B58DBE6
MKFPLAPGGRPGSLGAGLPGLGASPLGGGDRLAAFTDFAPNPGALAAHAYVPDDLEPGAALVVVLHGCTQNAAGYDHGSGWSWLAERHGFALLFPEQARANNPNLCFNWFQPKDTARGQGEAASIAAMIGAMAERHGIDPARVHVTGLSAGGAMASAMLAAYPELFASGAIIAGLPHGVAAGVPQALDAMAGRAVPDADTLGGRVRAASNHAGPWPRVSVWQGDADSTVTARNGAAVAAQWRHVHGLGEAAAVTEPIGPHRRTAWTDAEGRAAIELYEIAGMGHGVPLNPGTGEGEAGTAGAHMLDAGIDSTGRIAAFFGVGPEAAAGTAAAKARAAKAKPVKPNKVPAPTAKIVPLPRPAAKRAEPEQPSEPSGVQAVIEKALKAAGLM